MIRVIIVGRVDDAESCIWTVQATVLKSRCVWTTTRRIVSNDFFSVVTSAWVSVSSRVKTGHVLARKPSDRYA